jgi:hypothetical protein
MRRLTDAQYLQAIAYVFGPDIDMPRTFEPETRREGLLAIGSSVASISPYGLEQYDHMARTIAAQVVDEKHRARVIGCAPVAADKPDDTCAARFYSKVGRLLFRRPVPAATIASHVATARATTQRLGDFYAGLADGLAPMLIDSRFLFRWEKASATAPDRLDDYSIASRLSYLLWNATPDAELLDAAAKGALSTPKGLKTQVDRLTASPNLKVGVRAFFGDMLEFDAFAALSKDTQLYPKFSPFVARDAMEQTLRTIDDLLIDKNDDFRKLFVTRVTFMTRLLGMVYGVQVKNTYDGWQRFEFDEDSPYAGILTQISFTALHAYPGRSSATLRGKAFRELLTCEKVPPPPPNVDFSLVENTNNAVLKTARDRLTEHRKNPACASCHRMMDPIGLGFENFDGLGAYRTMENGAQIDASGEFNGSKFSNTRELGKVLSENAAVPACLAKRVFEYGVGRPVNARAKTVDSGFVKTLLDAFAADGYRVPALLRRLALSEPFYAVSRS